MSATNIFESVSSSPVSGLAALASGLEQVGTTVFGENGTPQVSFTTTTNIERLLVALKGFANHSRGHERSVGTILSQLSQARKKKPEFSQDIFKFICLMMAHTRDCRKEGKGVGSRSPTWIMFIWAWTEFPDCRDQLKKVFTNLYELFGSMNDLNLLYANAFGSEGLSGIHAYIVDEWTRHLKEVRRIVDIREKGCATGAGADPIKLPNLAAKWAPREGKKHGPLARTLAKRLFPEFTDFKMAFRAYRKMLSAANKMLDVAEVHMCHDASNPDCPKSGDWNVALDKTPGRCLHVHKKAFQRRIPIRWEAFMESLKKPDSKGAKGTSVFITELARALVRAPDELAEAQWQDQVRNLQEAAGTNGLDLGEFLGNFVCLLDFSGSMMGDPMDLAMALGAFITPLQKGAFKGKCLSFETRPHWVDISGATTIHNAMRIYERSPWGGSTNFQAAHQMILDVVSDHIKSGGSGDILPKFFLVVSDMQFDIATGSNASWETMHQTLKRMYEETGRSLGVELKLPMMIYWNARSNTGGMPVAENTDGAIFISGTSTAIVKTFLTIGVEKLIEMTPWKYLYETLSDPWYLRVLEDRYAPRVADAGAGTGADAGTDAGAAAGADAGGAGAGGSTDVGCGPEPSVGSDVSGSDVNWNMTSHADIEALSVIYAEAKLQEEPQKAWVAGARDYWASKHRSQTAIVSPTIRPIVPPLIPELSTPISAPTGMSVMAVVPPPAKFTMGVRTMVPPPQRFTMGVDAVIPPGAPIKKGECTGVSMEELEAVKREVCFDDVGEGGDAAETEDL